KSWRWWNWYVINIGKLKDKDYDYVLKDIMVVKHACGKHVLKVIVETALLTKEEIENDVDINQLGLSVRSLNALKRIGKTKASEVAAMTWEELEQT
ncbi:DNA-directed RNA polymerase subunit alpha C-terminal domain-containing protein, partial [Mycoplasmopsis bovis]|uniref:DNA-directed RNA polymerase subunit alpha C-terminal domain-containing protein n=1 Tax=Mycoplasmopsis bovis TaxID=28903 RepID=UPI003D279856